MLDGTYKIIIIEVHPEPNGTYQYADLGNGNTAELVRISNQDVPYYKEVNNATNEGRLFR